jgi:hypothetical protein
LRVSIRADDWGAAVVERLEAPAYAIWGGVAGLVISGLAAKLALRAFDRVRDSVPE